MAICRMTLAGRGCRRPRRRRRTRRSRRPGAGTAWPSATWPRARGEVAGLARRTRAAGRLASCLRRAPRGRASSGQAGCCAAGRSRQDEGAQVVAHRAPQRGRVGRAQRRWQQPKTSIGRPRRAGRPIGQEAGRAGGATASAAGAVGVPLRTAHLVPAGCAVRLPQVGAISAAARMSQAASLRARASSRTAVTARFTSRRAASAVTPSVSPTSR